MKVKSLGIQFDLDSGRTVNVDLLTIETKYKDVITGSQLDDEPSLLIKRRCMDVHEDQWTDGGEIHFIFPENLSEVSSADNSVLVSAVLWSEPISEGFGFSELMVVFFANYKKRTAIEQMLWEGLHDLAWEDLAVDRYGAVSTT
jgi:hypothetical protein